MIKKSIASRFAFNGVTLFGILIIYVAVHCILRLSFSGNFTTDDADSALHAVTLKWAYSIYQPPLYEWVLWFFQKLFGFHLLANLVTKYVFLGGACFFLYHATKDVLNDKGKAFLSVLSFLLFYQVGWNLLEGATQTSAVIFASSMTLWAALKIIKDGGKLSYLLFSLSSFLGLMAKFSFPIFWLAVFLALLAIKNIRHLVNWKCFFLSTLGTLLLSSPYFISVLSDSSFFDSHIAKMNDSSSKTGVDDGLKVLTSYLLYSLAFLPVFLVCFFKQLSLANQQENEKLKFVSFVFVFCFLLVLSGAILFGVDNIKERHLHPFFLTLPMVLFGFLSIDKMDAHPVKSFVSLIVVAVFGIFIVRFVVLAFPYKEICGRCREMVPYVTLAEKLEVYQPFDRIIVGDTYLAANLSRFFAPEKVLLAENVKNRRCSLILLSHNEWADAFSNTLYTLNADWQGLFSIDRKTEWFLADLRQNDKNPSCKYHERKPDK